MPLSLTASSRSSPDVLTYCYDSRMVYVIPAETYDQAIDLVQESFPELRDVDRDRIRLEVRVVLNGNQPPGPVRRQSAEIGRSAWSAVVSTLARFEIVEIQLAEPPGAGAPSGLRSSIPEPPPYETGEKVSATKSGSQISSSQSRSQPHLQPQSLTSRLANLLSRSSRGRHPA